jgi:hypothetical protein
MYLIRLNKSYALSSNMLVIHTHSGLNKATLCKNTVTCRSSRVTYKTGLGLDYWIYYTLYIHNPGLQAIQRCH